jgi:hypothetical protein
MTAYFNAMPQYVAIYQVLFFIFKSKMIKDKITVEKMYNSVLYIYVLYILYILYKIRVTILKTIFRKIYKPIPKYLTINLVLYNYTFKIIYNINKEIIDILIIKLYNKIITYFWKTFFNYSWNYTIALIWNHMCSCSIFCQIQSLFEFSLKIILLHKYFYKNCCILSWMR